MKVDGFIVCLLQCCGGAVATRVCTRKGDALPPIRCKFRQKISIYCACLANIVHFGRVCHCWRGLAAGSCSACGGRPTMRARLGRHCGQLTICSLWPGISKLEAKKNISEKSRNRKTLGANIAFNWPKRHTGKAPTTRRQGESNTLGAQEWPFGTAKVPLLPSESIRLTGRKYSFGNEGKAPPATHRRNPLTCNVLPQPPTTGVFAAKSFAAPNLRISFCALVKPQPAFAYTAHGGLTAIRQTQKGSKEKALKPTPCCPTG